MVAAWLVGSSKGGDTAGSGSSPLSRGHLAVPGVSCPEPELFPVLHSCLQIQRLWAGITQLWGAWVHHPGSSW